LWVEAAVAIPVQLQHQAAVAVVVALCFKLLA
jgi:hypothetical protein